jgi:K+-transporting ATPase ATPase A chain
MIYLEWILFLLLFLGLAFLMGKYMASVYQGEKTFFSVIGNPLENLIYKWGGVNPDEEMNWKKYAFDLVLFNLLGFLVVFILQVIQGYLPLNPAHLANIHWDLALNTAISFMTNTNWQSYSGETTLSWLVQMLALTVQNFLSAATGMAAMVAMLRGFTRRETDKIGNFWVDMTRSTVYILLPLAFLFAILLVSQGVLQTFHPYQTIATVENQSQVLPSGPVASQVAIKQLGSNGGGFFGVNSAHPFENPNGLANIFELAAILFLPLALVFTFGYLVGNFRQGIAFLISMLVLLLLGMGIVWWADWLGNPILIKYGIAHGISMEGVESRFGVYLSSFWGLITTATSNGSVNSMHDSLMPLASLVYMFNMGVGEVIFGGVGVGLIGMLYFALLAMFLAGLMIGRTPEFLGKKLGPEEMYLSVMALLSPPILMLVFAAIALLIPSAAGCMNNSSAHGLSEILYAFLSGAGNNGSAFAGLNTNTPYYNLSLGLTMFLSRFVTILPALAIGGSLAQKKTIPVTIATFPTTGILFIAMLIAVVIIMGALTFFPIFTIGPLLDHLFMIHGKVF